MLSRLIEFSLRQRALVLLGVLALAGAGLAAFLQLPIDAYPDISPTQVKLIIKAPGMTPEEVKSSPKRRTICSQAGSGKPARAACNPMALRSSGSVGAIRSASSRGAPGLSWR